MSWTAERLGNPDGELMVVFIHGGFWRARFSAETIAPIAAACADLGYAVWNLEYPRVGMAGGGWPGTAEAVRAAVRAAAGTAAAGTAAAGTTAAGTTAAGTTAGRPMVLVGHSAGGHLALWAAADVPAALIVSLAGVVDLEAGARERIGEDAVVGFLGASPDDDPDRYAAASPLRQLPLGSPSLLIHGDADDRVPLSQSRSYLEAARAAGDDCELVELPGGDHFEVIDPRGRAWPVVVERLARLARLRA